MNVSWTGLVDSRGRLKLDDRDLFFGYLLNTFRGKRVVLSVDERGTRRTNAQNAYLWAVVYPAIADHCGYDHHDHETLHYDLLSVRFGTVEVAPKIAGLPTRVMPKRTSSQLTTKEMSDYLEWVVRYAAEHFGVVIALPDEVPQ